MGFLAIYSNTDCNVEAAMGFLAISSNTDWNGKAAMEFLTICSNTCLLYTSPSPRDS